MRNEFVTYDIALAMTQLGWGWHKGVMGWYCNTTQELRQDDNLPVGVIYAPLYQQAFRWFKEVHGLNFNINMTYSNFDKAMENQLRKLIEIVKEKKHE